MQTFDFTIVASGLDPAADDFETRFYDGGCDDSTVAFQKGHIIIEFSREAGTHEQAISSAIVDVRRLGAHVDRVEPDPLVSLSDMASRSDMTRAAMSNYFKGARGHGFPAPRARITTASPLWDWADVSLWMLENGKTSFEVAHAATVVSVANDLVAEGSVDIAREIPERVEQRMKAFA